MSHGHKRNYRNMSHRGSLLLGFSIADEDRHLLASMHSGARFDHDDASTSLGTRHAASPDDPENDEGGWLDAGLQRWRDRGFARD